MDRLKALSMVGCTLCIMLLVCCSAPDRPAEATATLQSSTGATGQDGEILGIVNDVRGMARLGRDGPQVPVTDEGFFTFHDVAPGCYDIWLEEAGQEPVAPAGATACVRPGQSVVLTIVFGQV